MSSLLPDLSQREISEQPDATQKLLDVGWPDNQEIASTLKREKNRYMFLAAGGTFDNAGLFAKYLQA